MSYQSISVGLVLRESLYNADKTTKLQKNEGNEGDKVNVIGCLHPSGVCVCSSYWLLYISLFSI